MPRLVNEEIEQMLLDVKKDSENASDALYNQFKAMTKIVGTGSFSGGGADAYKQYINNVQINYINKFLNLTQDVVDTINEIKTLFLSFESSNSGIVGSGTLTDVKDGLNTYQNQFSNLVSEIESLNNQASQHISIKKLSSHEVENDYQDTKSKIEEIKEKLSSTDSEALSKVNTLKQDVLELSNIISTISNEYHQKNGRIDFDKAAKISDASWYKIAPPTALMKKANGDPYSYEIFGLDEHRQLQEQKGFLGGLFIVGGGAHALDYSGYNISDKYYREGGIDATTLSAEGYAQFTKYFKMRARLSAIEVHANYKTGFTEEYKGMTLSGAYQTMHASASGICGTDNFNGYIRGEASLLSANGFLASEIKSDGFKFGIGGGASAASASVEGGFSFLKVPSADGKDKNLFGFKLEPKLDAGVSGDFHIESQKINNFGPIDINTVTVSSGLSALFGLKGEVTVPWPTLNLGWGI